MISFLLFFRAQETYTNSENPSSSETLQYYQSEISSTTSAFSILAQELTKIVALFSDNGRKEVTDIIRNIQGQEKEKLQLVS